MNASATHGETDRGPRESEVTCVFCASALERSSSPFDEVIADGPHGKIVPALGMMVPGYFLALTNAHVGALADLSAADISSFYAWVDAFTAKWEPQFGRYFAVEHGSCPGSKSGSCIDHAHLHLVPLAALLENALLTEPGLNWRSLASSEDLAALRASGYVSLKLDRIYVARDVCLPSQWLRRIMARELGLEVWDWALDYGRPNLEATRNLLSHRVGAA